MEDEINHDSQRYQHIDRWKLYDIKEEFLQEFVTKPEKFDR